MRLVPQSTVGKLLAAAWVLACVGILAFAWLRRDLRSMPEAVALLMVFVSLPVSIAIAPLMGTVTTALVGMRLIQYDPFVVIMPLWIALSVAGYCQWFVLLPALWRRGPGKPGGT